ncbi:hypothetical protein [Catenuloplanes indicus]|uniref:Uncharacterized protein n=1 Tax=Catenuloplanes indicus TaxID=137267 RepID=A0AAE3VXI9_9ACTN|nr:hypothetical protein [Catenuloplanes indicus]MDQ0365122.1 hypothetical protein [Catenuloplanes indicus]
MAIENRPDDRNNEDATGKSERPDGPVKRADARIGSAGGGPYPLADPERDEAEES